MPRQLRIDIPDTVYHIFTRGNNRSPLFFDDEDRFTFLKFLKRSQDRCPLDCLGYSLMTNHYHLQVKTRDMPLGKTLHYLNTLYASHFNYRYKQVGHVFQNRFHSIPVQIDRYLLALSRYIHLNAVEAKMVQRPEEHEWSSYRAYLGLASSDLVRPELVLDTLCEDRALQRQRYKEFVEEKMNRSPQFTEKVLGNAKILGDDGFVRSIAALSPKSFALRNDRRSKEAI